MASIKLNCLPSCSHSYLIYSAQAPPEESKALFLQYAALEESHGLARSAMEVYDKAVKTVPQADRLAVYDLYLARAHEFFGLGKVRAHVLCFLREDCGCQCVSGTVAQEGVPKIDASRA